MTFPGEEEPGVLSPQLQQQQSCKFSGTIPIKKRRFPLIRPQSPSPEEKPYSSEGDESKEEKDSTIRDRGLSVDASKDVGLLGKAYENQNLALPDKEERVTDISAQVNMNLSSVKLQEANSGSTLCFHDDLKLNLAENERSVEPKVSGSRAASHVLDTKQELVGGQGDEICTHKLSSGLMNAGLLVGANKPYLYAVEHKTSEGIDKLSGKSDLSSLSLSLSREKNVSLDNNNSSSSDVNSGVCVSRSNWDLNTIMDDWDGSVQKESLVYKTNGICRSENTKVGCFVKSSSSGSGAVIMSLNKGKQVLDEHVSNSCNTSVQSSLQYKSTVNLSLSLAIPFRPLGAKDANSSLSDNIGSETTDPKISWGRLQPPNMNLNFTSARNVKSEPVDENFNRDCSTGSNNHMAGSKLCSVKREYVQHHYVESIHTQKLVDCTSKKSESVLQGIMETSESSDTAQRPSVGKIMQHQESSASSSSFSIPSTPQNSFPSRFSTCLELSKSRDFSDQSEHSFLCKESHYHRNITDECSDGLVPKTACQNDNQLRLCKTEDLSVHDAGNGKLESVVDHSLESHINSKAAANQEEKMNLSTEMLEEHAFGYECKSNRNLAFSTHADAEEKLFNKEDEEYEDGEVREKLGKTEGESVIIEETKTEIVSHVESDCRNMQFTDFADDQNSVVNDFGKKAVVTDNNNETSEKIKDQVLGLNELQTANAFLQNRPLDKVKEVDVKSICVVSPEISFDLSGRKNVYKGDDKEVSTETKGSHGIGIILDSVAVDKVVEICPEKHDSTLSKVEVSVNGNDDAKDSDSLPNKSRIITLPRASVAINPGKTKSISSRFLTPRTGKERYSDFHEEMNQRGNRNELFFNANNRTAKDRFHSRSFKDARQGFMFNKGRVSGRFGLLHNEWDSDRDCALETCRNDYWVSRCKNASAMSDKLEYNGYDITPDGSSLGSRRRKLVNDELHSLRRPPLRRLSPEDLEGQVTRGIQMPRRFPRNISPSRYTFEDGPDFVGLRHDEKFMQQLSDDIIDPTFPRPHTLFQELDGQLVRGYRNFSTHRKNYPRICSKSPIRSRIRSPGPWSSPNQRSPNGLPVLNQHSSPIQHRTGRARSPDHACYRDEMASRRLVSPSYVTRHTNGLRDLDSGREHVHPRPANSNRRSPSGLLFARGAGRADVLNSRERADGDDYSNGPVHSNKFEELHCDGSFNERRNFSERRGPIHSFRSTHVRDSANYQFHLNNGPRPYRFGQDNDSEFIERMNLREREFDGNIKHPPLNVSRRVRDIEEQQNRNSRSDERMWHGDGLSDVSGVKRRRF